MKFNLKKSFKKTNTKFYQKVFLFDKDEYFSALTGERVNKMKTMSGIIIQKSQTNQTSHSIKEKKANTLFLYQTKDKKKYIMANSITTNFMRDVLFDYFGTNAVVVKMPSFILVFFGHNRQEVIKIQGKNEKDIESTLGTIYQGIEYETIEFIDFYKLIKKEKKLLPIVLLGVSIVLMIAVYLNMEDEDEWRQQQAWQQKMMESQKNNNKQQSVITDYNLVGIYNTGDSIKNLFNIELEAGSFVGDFDMGQGRLTIFSFAPMQDSFLKEDFFKKIIRIQKRNQYNKKPFELRTPEECMDVLGKYEDVLKLNAIQKENIDFSMQAKGMDTDRLTDFLKDIYRCPILIKEGYVKYMSLEKRNVQLNLKLLKQ